MVSSFELAGMSAWGSVWSVSSCGSVIFVLVCEGASLLFLFGWA
jgi:hypothetical protein